MTNSPVSTAMRVAAIPPMASELNVGSPNANSPARDAITVTAGIRDGAPGRLHRPDDGTGRVVTGGTFFAEPVHLGRL